MNCEKLREMLIDYIEGALEGKEKAEFEAHLQTCPECRELIKSFGKLSVSVKDHLDSKASRIETPPLLWAKILSTVQSQKKASRTRGIFKVAMTFASIVVVVLAGTFTPVFGKEGNLLNFISAKVIDNAASNLANLFTPDFKGQVLKTYALDNISSQNGVTQAQVWQMKSSGFTPKDIAVATYIASKSGRPVEEIIAERQSGSGWGRIANQSGISVFAVGKTLAASIEDETQKVANVDRIDIPVTVSDIENNRILVDSISEPVDLGGVVPVDQNNVPIELTEIEPSDFTMSFTFTDGKLELSNLRLENPTKPDKSKFTVEGKVISYDGSKLVVETSDGKQEIVTVAGETSMHALASVGEDIRVTGFVVNSRLTASAISRGRMRRMMAGRKARQEEKPVAGERPVNRETRNGNGGKPQNRGENKGNQQNKPEQQKTQDTTTNKEKNNGNNNPEPKTLNVDTAFVAFDHSTSLLTVVGNKTYLVGNTSVYINIGATVDMKPVGLGILGILQPDTKMLLSGSDNKVASIIIDKSEFAQVSGWIVNIDGSQITVLSKPDGVWARRVLTIPDWASIEPSREAMKPGSRISMALVGNGNVVFAIIEKTQFRSFEGKVDTITQTSIVIKGQEYALTAITEFLTDTQNPRDIKPGMPVIGKALLIDNQLVAIVISKAPPPPREDQRPIRISSISRKGEGKIELTLEDGRVIYVNPKMTKIFRDVDGNRVEASITDLREGLPVVFRLGQQGQMAVEITVVSQ